ncbi:phospholipase A1-like [Bicyclus anynana]|uniref:Phospholipase A1-like n=1 Tax=Bicyclus anynana TaxID=110368 RepID=A0ABM3LKI0_BICAN|nr:phospholipase A1-like [Bicyclus anynana]
MSVGKLLGEALVKLSRAGLEPCKIHLIGFSLGAPLMGYAAREVQKTGESIATVIGLDPARPLFDAFSLPCLDAASASFVAIIHTNPGALGTVESTGTVDIWFNCKSPIQPGCISDQCSHSRSWEYFVEMLSKPNNNKFIARRAKSCETWSAKGETITVGDKSHSK